MFRMKHNSSCVYAQTEFGQVFDAISNGDF